MREEWPVRYTGAPTRPIADVSSETRVQKAHDVRVKTHGVTQEGMWVT